MIGGVRTVMKYTLPCVSNVGTPAISRRGSTGSASAGTTAYSTASSIAARHGGRKASDAVSNSVQRGLSMNAVLGIVVATIGAKTATTPSAASGRAHRRCLREGAASCGTGSITISCSVNVSELTTAAGWIAGLAIVALIASGWRKPARATVDHARAPLERGTSRPAQLVEQRAPLVEHTTFWRRVWSGVASGGLALWVGAVTATVIAFGGAWIVITLTDMLKK